MQSSIGSQNNKINDLDFSLYLAVIDKSSLLRYRVDKL